MRWLIPAIVALLLACGQAGATPPVAGAVGEEREVTFQVQALI